MRFRYASALLAIALVVVFVLPLCLVHPHDPTAGHLCPGFGPVMNPAPALLLAETGLSDPISVIVYRADPADLPAPPPKA